MKLSEQAKNLKPGIYEHFKGMVCEVLGVAYDSETLEEKVVYKELKDNNLWVRPVDMFLERSWRWRARKCQDFDLLNNPNKLYGHQRQGASSYHYDGHYL